MAQQQDCPMGPSRNIEQLEEPSRNLSQADKLAARVLAWERRTNRIWDDDQVTFARLSEEYQLPLKEFFPDDPVFGVLRRIDEGRKIYPEDFQIMALRGVPDFEDRLPAIRLRQAHIREWETRSGRNWGESVTLFRKLTRRYKVPITDHSPDTPIFEILLRLDNGAVLAPGDLEVLASQGAPELASRLDQIRINEIRYHETRNPGILARIASLWRLSGRPDLGFDATARVLNNDHRPAFRMSGHTEAMLLTTRGACLRLLERLADARLCAERAIQLSPDGAHAYCLLGAIDIECGYYDSGESNFVICEERDPRMTANKSRREAIRHAKLPSEYAAYLIDKDPYRFGWARDYL